MISRIKQSGGRKSRVKNVMANWGGYLFAAVANFFLSPFIVHGLGDVSYGIWVLLGSLVGYLGLLDLGVRGAVTRFISKFHTQEDHLASTRVASSALTIFSLLGLLATIAAVVLSLFIDRFFDIPQDLVADARLVLILGGVNIAVSMISGVYGGIIVGLQRFDISNTVEISIGILRVTAIVVAVKMGIGIIVLAAIQLAASSLRALVNFWISHRLYPEVKTTFTEYRLSHARMILTFSVSVLLLQASGKLILFTDAVVIGSYLPLGMVTLFAIASNLTEYARAPISGITHTVAPWASTLEAKDEMDELQRVLLAAAKISTLIVFPIVLTFMLRGESFIGLWMGPEYAVPSGKVLRLLGLALLFATGYQVIVATMMGISRHGGLVPAFMIEALFNIGLSVLWVRSYGIIGVAWGTLVPRLVASCLFAPWYARRIVGTPILTFWLTVWIRPALAMIPFGVGSLLIERWWPADNLFLYFAQVIIALPLAVIAAWMFCMTPEEKKRLIPDKLLKRRVPTI